MYGSPPTVGWTYRLLNWSAVPRVLERISDVSTEGWYNGSTHVHMNYAGNLGNSLENLMMMSNAEDMDIVLEEIANKDNRSSASVTVTVSPETAHRSPGHNNGQRRKVIRAERRVLTRSLYSHSSLPYRWF